MIKKAATMLAALVTCFLTPMANAAAETIPTTAPPAIITTAPRAGDSEPIAEESPTCSPSVTFNGPTESARQFGRTDSQRGAVAARLVDQTEKSSSLGADVLKVARLRQTILRSRPLEAMECFRLLGRSNLRLIRSRLNSLITPPAEQSQR